MSQDNLWLLDRSRYEAGYRCPRLRYLNYHAGLNSKGYQPKEGKLPLLRGIWIHEGLAQICNVLKSGNKVDDTTVRMAASYAVTGYAKEVHKRGSIEGIPEEHLDFTVKEQLTLVEGSIWAWARVMLPIFESELEVISVEEEEHFDIPLDNLTLRFMSRPDLLVRTKAGVFAGQVGVVDFKTKESRINEWWISQWRDSIQMATITMAAERRLGEPVSHYYLNGLIVGGREHFTRNGKTTPEERQYSHLCYARIHPPNPPTQPTTGVEFKGYWADKQPTWEYNFEDREEGQSLGEYLVKRLPPKILDEIFVYAGPYERQEGMIKSLPQEIAGHEANWIQRQWDLYEAGGSEEALDRAFPRSYQCWYGKYRCEFYGPCREGKSWDDYEERKPHHEPEITKST